MNGSCSHSAVHSHSHQPTKLNRPPTMLGQVEVLRGVSGRAASSSSSSSGWPAIRSSRRSRGRRECAAPMRRGWRVQLVPVARMRGVGWEEHMKLPA